MRWSVIATEKARRELDALSDDMRADFTRISETLESSGPQRVGMPHVRHLEKALWEMRMKGRDGVSRAIYFAAIEQRLIVVRAFVKKTQKTPNNEIKLAMKRMKEWKDENET